MKFKKQNITNVNCIKSTSGGIYYYIGKKITDVDIRTLGDGRITNIKNYQTYVKDKSGNKRILHREDGPAVELSNGNKFWYKNGKPHRINGPAAECVNGNKYWYKNGYPHREDGPAMEFSTGDKFWYKNGKYHREDGPAIEFANGGKFWYLNGKRYSSKQGWNEALKNYK